MTSVRIVVDDRYLGDVEITQYATLTTNIGKGQRRVIQQLIDKAIAQVTAAYGLDDEQEESDEH